MTVIVAADGNDRDWIICNIGKNKTRENDCCVFIVVAVAIAVVDAVAVAVVAVDALLLLLLLLLLLFSTIVVDLLLICC